MLCSEQLRKGQGYAPISARIHSKKLELFTLEWTPPFATHWIHSKKKIIQVTKQLFVLFKKMSGILMEGSMIYTHFLCRSQDTSQARIHNSHFGWICGHKALEIVINQHIHYYIFQAFQSWTFRFTLYWRVWDSSSKWHWLPWAIAMWWCTSHKILMANGNMFLMGLKT